MTAAFDIERYRDLNPVVRVLMGPGPSDVPPRVLRAMAAPTLGHLDPDFLQIMTETQELLRAVFQTSNGLTIPVSGTGSSGMETCFVNLVEPGEQVAIIVNGVFGARMVDCAGRLGADVIPIEFEWGRAANPDVVRDALRGKQPKILAVVHAETSTGVLQPMDGLVQVAKNAGALMMVDCVTYLGGVEVELDEWGVDLAFSGTQKCLSCPPGLAPLSFGEAAVRALAARKSKVPSWYFDLSMVADYWGSARKYHHTAPINMIYALRESLRMILEEGLEARFARHKLNQRALIAGLEAMGLKMVVPEAERLASLTTVFIPDGGDDAGTRRALLQQFGIEIGAGLGPLAGKIWRVGLQGHSSNQRNVMLFLAALESVLRTQGVKVGLGAPEAAEEVYAVAG